MKKITVLLGIALFAIAPAFAQHKHETTEPAKGDHKHGSPHGGTVMSASNGYHIELLNKDGKLTAYLLDGKEKEVSVSDASASAIIQMADGSTNSIKFAAMANAFEYTLDKTKKYNKAIISIKTGGKSATATFDLKSKSEPHKH